MRARTMPIAYATPIWKIAEQEIFQFDGLIWTGDIRRDLHDNDSPAILPRTNAAVDPTPGGQSIVSSTGVREKRHICRSSHQQKCK